MPRSTRQDVNAAGHDSFLDIVANIVGILIILVIVVGVRARDVPIAAAIRAATQASAEELRRDLATEESLRGEIFELAGQIRSVRQEAAHRHVRRARLATQVAAREHQIECRRAELNTEAQEEFDLKRRLTATEDKLQQLRREAAQAEQVPSAPIRIESFPTPLSVAVNGPEVHLQLRAGLVTVVPWEPLIRRFEADFRRQLDKLQTQPELTDRVGPIDGFRLRYTVERRGNYARLKILAFLPVHSRLGETIQQALTTESELHKALVKYHPSRTTVTIWTYPDSFAEFRRLKKSLYQMGFSVAARPLPHGTPISGSPEGSRSAAQ